MAGAPFAETRHRTAPALAFWVSAVVSCVAGISTARAHPATGIVVDSKGHVTYVDFVASRIYRTDDDGKPQVIARGDPEATFTHPHHLVLDSAGNVYTASDHGGSVWRIDPKGALSAVHRPSTEACRS